MAAHVTVAWGALGFFVQKGGLNGSCLPSIPGPGQAGGRDAEPRGVHAPPLTAKAPDSALLGPGSDSPGAFWALCRVWTKPVCGGFRHSTDVNVECDLSHHSVCPGSVCTVNGPPNRENRSHVWGRLPSGRPAPTLLLTLVLCLPG